VWTANQPQPWSVDFFELSGCGHHVLWGCRLPSRTSSSGVHAFSPYTRDLPWTESLQQAAFLGSHRSPSRLRPLFTTALSFKLDDESSASGPIAREIEL
jgi:hypothetical protein